MSKPLAAFSLLFVVLSLNEANIQAATPEDTSKRASSGTSEPARAAKPNLPLLEGLKVAETYIQREQIDLSRYWLAEARFIVYGHKGKNSKSFPAWYFCWQNTSPSLGDYIEIVLSMDGKAMRVPSI
jgi:hypothetical protein